MSDTTKVIVDLGPYSVQTGRGQFLGPGEVEVDAEMAETLRRSLPGAEAEEPQPIEQPAPALEPAPAPAPTTQIRTRVAPAPPPPAAPVTPIPEETQV